MRIIVCGGRDFVNVPLLWRVLDQLDSDSGPHGISVVIEGASDDVTGPYKGADYWAHQWAMARGKPTIRQHADWKQYGRSAGPRRNGVMLKEHGPEWLVAFPGGKGTANMISQAQDAGVYVQIVTG
jgi:hypothetical protein